MFSQQLVGGIDHHQINDGKEGARENGDGPGDPIGYFHVVNVVRIDDMIVHEKDENGRKGLVKHQQDVLPDVVFDVPRHHPVRGQYLLAITQSIHENEQHGDSVKDAVERDDRPNAVVLKVVRQYIRRVLKDHVDQDVHQDRQPKDRVERREQEDPKRRGVEEIHERKKIKHRLEGPTYVGQKLEEFVQFHALVQHDFPHREEQHAPKNEKEKDP